MGFYDIFEKERTRRENAKKKTPKEIIESTQPSNVEHGYIKIPREELIESSAEGESELYKPDREGHWPNQELTREIYEKRGGKRHSYLHTHVYPNKVWPVGLPSSGDFKLLFSNAAAEKSGIVAQRDEETGKVQGYTFVHLNEKVPTGDFWKNTFEIRKDADKFYLPIKEAKNDSEREEAIRNYEKGLSELGKKYGFRIKTHAARGYHFNENTGDYEKNNHSLEGAVSAIVLGFIFLFLLVKVPIMGNVISNVTSNSSLGLHAGLFVIGGLVLSAISYLTLKPYKARS